MRSRTRTSADAPATVEASAVESTAVDSAAVESTDTAVLEAVRPARVRRGSPLLGPRRPALLLGAAAAGALVVGVLSTSSPAASAGTDTVSASVSVAEQLGIPQQPAASAPAVEETDLAPLEDLAASRSQRSADETTAAQAQAAADQAELDRRAAEEAARIAAEQEAARRAAEEAAARAAAEQAAAAAAAEQAAAAQQQSTSAAAPAPAASAAPAARGSFKEYAMSKVGSGEQFSCLESLWGKESGWNPNAQNPSSTAYGIPQFLDSTWASTGIAKTSDGYRQIDAGLIYIEERYGSPCAAWAHSQSTGWY
ncbi:transglycosylase SLT domain-containing protein [Geodermatophilus nigrescens]|uniref:Transglycosylase SLT domain-containing protein n=1 Tax=Geodermatophilus nigrescens TaxID=1070870 RepID=A0A1M5IW00_9ACTN|nr:transglycosylase SLT domain-containing protein [Geodermatophilus nigrescens]SHG32140.1 Transglycosylase SLT domain-containing protein [Geodermatophilus nigrescens]